MAVLSLSLLGPLQFALDGAPVEGFRSDKERALLAFLAVERDRPHRRESLAALLWPEQPPKLAFNNLSKALHRLRHALRDEQAAAPFLLVTPRSVQLSPAAVVAVDVAAFTSRLAETAAHRHRRIETCPICHQRLEQAAALYRGDFLHGFSLRDSLGFEEWAVVQRERLRQQALIVLSRLAGYYLRRSDFDRAGRFARRQIEIEPWRETAHRQLMLALSLAGDRAAALAQFQACRSALADELGVEPEAETIGLYEQIRGGDRGVDSGDSSLSALPDLQTPHNLPPPPAPFIGRASDLARLRDRLLDPDYRLLTVVGEGGMGKSRLALAAAEQVLDDFRDGAWFVPLAGVAGGASQDAMAAAIAAAIGLTFAGPEPPGRQLLAFLHNQERLLLLDNFEHLLVDGHAEGSAVELVRRLLAAAPQVTCLVTSREALDLQAEFLVRLDGLPAPASDSDLEAMTYDSLRLFAERSERASGRQGLAGADLAAAIQVCRFLEGLPLGIELAAAWTRRMSPPEIAAAIRRDLGFLATTMHDVPKRHRSLRVVFEGSWQLLNDAERAVLAQASVFQGGFGLEAAQAVAGASAAVLTSLMDKSLLRPSPHERFDLHDLLRQFGAEKLKADERDGPPERHAAYFLDFVAGRGVRLRRPGGQAAAEEIRIELDNIQAAWRWAAARRWLDGLARGLDGLAGYFGLSGLVYEGRAAVGLAIEGLQSAPEATAGPAGLSLQSRLHAAQAQFLFDLERYAEAVTAAQQAVSFGNAGGRPADRAAGCLQWGKAVRRQGQYAEARAPLEQALALERQFGPWPQLASECLVTLAHAAQYQGDHSSARVHVEQALRISRDIGDQFGEAQALVRLGDLAGAQGDYGAARAAFEQELEISRQTGNRLRQCMTLNDLGDVARALGDYAAAQAFLEQSLRLIREIGGQSSFHSILLHNLGEVLHHRGDHRSAEVFSRQALQYARDGGTPREEAVSAWVLGNSLVALGNLDEADQMYRHALALVGTLGEPYLAAECRAGLARVALARRDIAEALAQAEAILEYLATGSLAGTEEPLLVYLTCYQVLRAAHDSRAAGVLQAAHELLYLQAARIADERLRRSFLENVPAHREIVRLTAG